MEQLRKSAFICFARFPDPAAGPACVDELRRAERKNDLRRIAISTLLRVGLGDWLRTAFERLPPTESEPETDLKIEVLMLLRGLAAASSPAELREEAARWTKQLQALVAKSDRAAYRIWAASALLRLGVDGMDATLRAEYDRAADEFHRDHALGWTALLLLAEDRSDPDVLRICLASADPDHESFESITALDILGRCYPEVPEALDLMWRNAESSGWIHYPTLIRLLRIDRPRAVGILRSHLEGDDEARQGEAVRLARREQLTELGPVITEIARRATLQRARLYLYGALTAMLDQSGYPLLLAALRPEESAEIRSAAATGLLAFGHDEGVDRVGALFESNDPVIRSVLFLRASAAGPAGVPDRLWDSVLTGLRSFANEDARLEALHICRVAGRLDRIGEALQEAYRLEPSRLVATRIRGVLIELAYR